jgi:5,10-methylenetetrahydrofolate reductase
MSLQSVLQSGVFAVTAEVGPLKGTDVTELMAVAQSLLGKVTAVNVTDQQSSVMRLGSLTVSHLLLEKGLEPVFQLTCRDRNRIALQSDLLSASVLGVKNVLAITGDLPQLGDHPQAKPVYDLDSVQLLSVIGKLNSGSDMNGNALKGKTDFFPGAVVNPGANTETSLKFQLLKMEKKIEAGARFFQTQAVFEPEKFYEFVKRTESFRVPILAGIIPLKNANMARFMNKNVAGVHVPDALIKQMADAKDKTQTGVEIASGLIRALKDISQGVHIMPIGWEAKVPQILAGAGLIKVEQPAVTLQQGGG